MQCRRYIVLSCCLYLVTWVWLKDDGPHGGSGRLAGAPGEFHHPGLGLGLGLMLGIGLGLGLGLGIGIVLGTRVVKFSGSAWKCNRVFLTVLNTINNPVWWLFIYYYARLQNRTNNNARGLTITKFGAPRNYRDTVGQRRCMVGRQLNKPKLLINYHWTNTLTWLSGTHAHCCECAEFCATLDWHMSMAGCGWTSVIYWGVSQTCLLIFLGLVCCILRCVRCVIWHVLFVSARSVFVTKRRVQTVCRCQSESHFFTLTVTQGRHHSPRTFLICTSVEQSSGWLRAWIE